MEDQKTKREEIQCKVYQAKTVEELLAIAVEAGEPLTPEEATKLLQEIEAERAREKQGFASADEDLSDEELAKVAGGRNEPIYQGDKTSTSFREMTYREGENVSIYRSSNGKYCEYWCKGAYSEPIDGLSIKPTVIRICRTCKHHSSRGGFRESCCSNSKVRAAYGL